MGIASIVLAVLAFLFMVLGLLFTPVPIVGLVFSLGAPALAIAGVIVGGVAMSRSRRQGSDSGTGMAGVIVGVLAFIPSLVVALTCGVCNACFSAAALDPDGALQWQMQRGGVLGSGAKQRGPGRAAPGAPGQPDGPLPSDKQQRQGTAGQSAAPGEIKKPPPVLPPPPIAPGPATEPAATAGSGQPGQTGSTRSNQ